MFFKLIFYSLVLFGYTSGQVQIFESPLSPRNANYAINARLFPEEQRIEATQFLRWKNISQTETDELWFHFYLNAFSHKKTTFMAESNGGKHRGQHFSEKYPGHIKVSKLMMGEMDLSSRIEFVQPDDGNVHDSTVVRIKLDRKILPNEEIELYFEFESKYPKVFARTGFSKDEQGRYFFLSGQWFPKIAVLENKGWNCHQFHLNTEFYADFGVYDVKLTVPKTFVVGATGVLSEQETTDSLTTYSYHAEDVIDFAWTAYEGFKVKQETHKTIDIRLLYNENEEAISDKQIQSVKHSIDYFGDKFGAYPYPNITVLNPPKGAGGAGGMEYPTFITVGHNEDLPEQMNFGYIMTTVHEFGHQYFQSLIATNEFEYSWMDEGFCTYGTSGTMDTYYNGLLTFDFLNVKAHDADRFLTIAKPNHEAIITPSYLQSPNNYAINSYPRPANYLKTLENYLGADLFFKGMRAYFDRWSFKHPKPHDWINTIEEATATDLSWFYQQYIIENRTIDYKLKSLRSSKIDAQNFVPLQMVEMRAEVNDSAKIYLNEIVILNNRNGYFPMELEVKLKDGTVLSDLDWDYKSAFNRIEFYSNSPARSAILDPENKIEMDLNRTNNGINKDVNSGVNKYINRFAYWAQSMVQMLSGF